MILTRLKAQNFRCVKAADLSLHNGINFLVGDNGAGKTSLLEAIYLLATGRTKRGDGRKVIRDGEECAAAYAEGTLVNGSSFRLGASLSRNGTMLKFNGEETSRTDVVKAIPVLFLDPGLHALVEEGPDERRRFLDWGVFHVEHAFLATWRRYRRLLRQRNAALNRGGEDVVAWDRQLEGEASMIDRMRSAYIEELEPVVDNVAREIFPKDKVAVDYRRGWASDEDLGEALHRQLAVDRSQGYTRSGPHRADLKLKLSGEHARYRLSRGELKLLSLILTIAQIQLHLARQNEPPILLLDDLAAELSQDRREQVVALLDSIGVQVVMTSIDGLLDITSAHRMFHVEQGVVRT